MNPKLTLAITTLAIPIFITAPPAAATTTADPVAALKAQFIANHGVKILEGQRTVVDGEQFNKGKRRGVVQFAPDGVTGFDYTMSTNLMDKPIRTLSIGPYTYQSGGAIAEALPKGKKWLRLPSKPGARSPFFTPVFILEPATLKAVLSTTSGTAAGVRKGAITLGALFKVSPTYRAANFKALSAKAAAVKVSWKLWTAKNGLPTRLVTAWTDDGALGPSKKTSDIRFTSWDTRSTLAAPPAAQTAS